jgi:hypothetical protein
MIPDHQIWESYMEDSRKVFQHFGVGKFEGLMKVKS